MLRQTLVIRFFMSPTDVSGVLQTIFFM